MQLNPIIRNKKMVIKNTINLKPNFVGFGNLVNHKTPLLATFQAYGRVNKASGFPIFWNVYTTEQDIVEGADVTSFEYQAEIRAQLPCVVKYIPIRLGAVMKANAEANGTYDQAMQNQIDKTLEDIISALEAAFCGATMDVGLQSIIGATGTYAGINQAMVTTWSSVEISCVNSSIYRQANILISALQTRGVNISNLCCFAHPTAIQKFQQSAATAGALNINSPLCGGPINVEKFPHQATFNGIPIVAVPCLPQGDMYFIDMSDASIEMLKGPVIEDIGGSKLAMVIMGALKITTRNRHGKLTGCDDLTAT
jgi:hypothetical protein